MKDLYSTNKKGKVITHLHNGIGHFMCGLADDYWVDDEKVIEKVEHNWVTCKDCIKQVKRVVKQAKKYGINQ